MSYVCKCNMYGQYVYTTSINNAVFVIQHLIQIFMNARFYISINVV